MAEYFVIAVAVFLGTTTQRIVGFGAPIIIIPAVLFYYPPTITITTVLTVGIIMSIIVVNSLKSTPVPWLILKRLTLVGLTGIFFGAYITTIIDKSTLQIVLGLAVIISINVQEFFLPKDNKPLKPDKSLYGFGLIAGFFNSTVGLSAAPLLVWLRKHRLKPNELRKMLAIVFIVANLLSIIIIAILDSSTLSEINFALLFGIVPVIYLANYIGQIASKKIGNRLFEKLAYIVLNATGIVCLINGIISLD